MIADRVSSHRRPHAAEEVYVTGTFDSWSKSEKLEKVGDHFEKTVTLPEDSGLIFYKVRFSLLQKSSIVSSQHILPSWRIYRE